MAEKRIRKCTKHGLFCESPLPLIIFSAVFSIMCDHLPPTVDSPDSYHVDNLSRSVGQVVTVYCKNATVAIVKCMPDFKWNATVPSCTGKDAGDNMGAMIIIVWVVGGVLLFSLLVLIIIIITSRSKAACGFRRNGSPSTSVFHISGATHRASGAWGDNPGFSRGDERCGEWSFHRTRPAESERLPSYQEAILNNCIRVPARTGSVSQQGASVRVNAPPSYRSCQLQNSRAANGGEGNLAEQPTNIGEGCSLGREQAAENRNSQPNLVADVQSANANPVTETQSTDPIAVVDNESTVNSQINGNTNTGNDQRRTDSDCVKGINEPQTSTAISREERSVRPYSSTIISRRYAENYPQCLFQDEPPPPYSSGHPRSSLHRSPVRHNLQPVREGQQNLRRSMHAVPTGRNQSQLRQNPNFRRSMHDRPENAVGPLMFNSNYRPHDHSNHSYHNINVFCVDNDTRSQSLAGSHYQPTHSSSVPRHAAGSSCQVSGVSDNSRNLQTFPTGSSVPNTGSSPSLQRYEPSVSATGNRIIHMNNNATSNGHDHQNTLYIVRNIQASSSVSPYLLQPQQVGLSTHPYHAETQPLCTSTPINQSPATDRKFVPASHPSPLLIPRPQHIQQGHSGQEELIFHRLRAELEGRYAYSASQNQPSLPQYLLHGKQLNPSRNPGAAPIARLDSEFL